MAPPSGARPGWSRRAQYGLFFGFLAVIAGTLRILQLRRRVKRDRKA